MTTCKSTRLVTQRIIFVIGVPINIFCPTREVPPLQTGYIYLVVVTFAYVPTTQNPMLLVRAYSRSFWIFNLLNNFYKVRQGRMSCSITSTTWYTKRAHISWLKDSFRFKITDNTSFYKPLLERSGITRHLGVIIQLILIDTASPGWVTPISPYRLWYQKCQPPLLDFIGRRISHKIP